MKIDLRHILIFAGSLLTVFSCETEQFGPNLPAPGDSLYVSPFILNGDRVGEVLDFTAPQDTFEIITWDAASYGVSLPVQYTLEASLSTDFSSIENVDETGDKSSVLTIKDINDVLLSLGAAPNESSTVYFRIKALVEGQNLDTLYSSNNLERIVTPYRLSECGDFCTIGIIGSATSGGWDNDTDMRIADPTGADLATWTVTLYLSVGEAKFRASDTWDTNWGNSAFPEGTGDPGGSNIPISTAGYYKVTFNDKSGDYSFSLISKSFSTVGIIGDATPGGWDSDTDLTQDPSDSHIWTGTVTLTDGEAKFRAENDWTDNWGETTYPSGFGTSGGPNIPVSAGTYFVWFNDASGEYAFINTSNSTPYATVGIIGDATAGGWDTDTDLIKNPSNPFRWSLVVTLGDGEAKFRADNDWAVNWGIDQFPSGVSVQNGPNIPMEAGSYVVSFHSGTGEFKFLK